MKYLALALLLCTQLHLLHGACQRFMLEFGATQCEDPFDKSTHAIDDSWTNGACQKCSCKGCCDIAFRPVGIPDDCTAELDKKTCEYKVFKKADPSVKCEYRGQVGK